MPNSITNRQMVFILVLSITCVSIISIPKVMAESAGLGSWLTLMLAALIAAAAAVVIVSLNKGFQGKVIFEYSQVLVGKIGAYIIAAFYILFFVLMSVYLLSSQANLVHADFLLKTPKWALSLLCLPVLGYAAYKGITNVARMLEIVGILFLIVVIAIHITMLIEGDARYILPLFKPSETGKYFSALPNTIDSFIGLEVLLVIPLSVVNKKPRRVAFLTMVGIGLLYVLVVDSSIMMIGMYEIVHYNDALVVAIRQVQLPFIEFLQRVDIFYLTIGFVSTFAGIIVFYLAATEYICRVFQKVKRIVVVCILGALLFILAVVGEGVDNLGKMFEGLTTYIGPVAAIVIPLLLFILMKVKKRVDKSV